MKRNKCIFWTIPLWIMFSICPSCNSGCNRTVNQPQTIHIDLDNRTKSSENIEIQEVVPLETSKELMIGMATKVVMCDTRIFVLDGLLSNTFYIFNNKGKSIFKTTRGKGPGEVISPITINVNLVDSTILLRDQYKKSLMIYDFNGKFISSTQQEKICAIDLFPIGKDTCLVYDMSYTFNSKHEPKTSTYHLYTQDFKNDKQFDILVGRKKQALYMRNPVYQSNREIVFVAPWHYNVYELNRDDYKIKYIFDFGKHSLSPFQLDEVPTEELFPEIKYKQKVGCFSSIFKNEHFLIINAEYG